MNCAGCGQDRISDGGIGCICNGCPRCEQGRGDYCFLCRPCKVCGRSIGMHPNCRLCETPFISSKNETAVCEDD